jgi:phenylalanyl-tRNA synthetase alpha chain
LDKNGQKIVDGLKKRKLVNVATIKSYKVTKGENFQPERQKLETDLNAEMLRTGAWKETKFKKYNFNA